MGMSDAFANGPWHAQELGSVWCALDSTEQGLTKAEAHARLERYGPNRLPQQPPPAWWQILLRQFQSPLIYILLAAAVVAVVVGDFKDAGFIAAVLAINALIGGYQEWRGGGRAPAPPRGLFPLWGRGRGGGGG